MSIARRGLAGLARVLIAGMVIGSLAGCGASAGTDLASLLARLGLPQTAKDVPSAQSTLQGTWGGALTYEGETEEATSLKAEPFTVTFDATGQPDQIAGVTNDNPLLLAGNLANVGDSVRFRGDLGVGAGDTTITVQSVDRSSDGFSIVLTFVQALSDSEAERAGTITGTYEGSAALQADGSLRWNATIEASPPSGEADISTDVTIAARLTRQ